MRETGQRRQAERLKTEERPGVVGWTWRRRTSFSSGVVERPATTAMERRWSVRQLVLPSTAAMAPLYVVRRRVAGPTCRRPARLHTDTTRLACWAVACLVYGRRLMAAVDWLSRKYRCQQQQTTSASGQCWDGGKSFHLLTYVQFTYQ